MSYEESTIYKDNKALQWCKEGLVCELQTVADKLMIADTREDILNILNALAMDVETVLDAVEQMRVHKEYFDKKEAEKNAENG